MAVGVTSVVVLGLTIFAFQTKIDFTGKVMLMLNCLKGIKDHHKYSHHPFLSMKSHLQSSVINKWREKNRLALPDASQQPNQPRLIQLNGIKSVNSSEVDVRWSSFGNLSMFNDIWFDRTLHSISPGLLFPLRFLICSLISFFFDFWRMTSILSVWT